MLELRVYSLSQAPRAYSDYSLSHAPRAYSDDAIMACVTLFHSTLDPILLEAFLTDSQGLNKAQSRAKSEIFTADASIRGTLGLKFPYSPAVTRMYCTNQTH